VLIISTYFMAMMVLVCVITSGVIPGDGFFVVLEFIRIKMNQKRSK